MSVDQSTRHKFKPGDRIREALYGHREGTVWYVSDPNGDWHAGGIPYVLYDDKTEGYCFFGEKLS